MYKIPNKNMYVCMYVCMYDVCCYRLALWWTGALVAFNATEETLELEAMYQRIRKTIIDVQ